MMSLILCIPHDFENNLVIYVAEYRFLESLSVTVLEICECTVMHFLPNASQIGSRFITCLSSFFCNLGHRSHFPNAC